MSSAAHMRPRRHEAGLTFVEVLLVMVIVAILVAIAIPTFVGAKKRAQDEQVQARLRTVLTAQNTLHRNDGRFAAGRDGGVAIRALGHEDAVVLSSTSRSGRTFCIARVASGRAKGTYYAQGRTCDRTTTTRRLRSRDGWSTRAESAW